MPRWPGNRRTAARHCGNLRHSLRSLRPGNPSPATIQLAEVGFLPAAERRGGESGNQTEALGRHVRLPQRAPASCWPPLAGLLVAAALVSGCSSIIHGKPEAYPSAGATTPSFPKAMPSPTAPPPGPPPPAGAIPLSPTQNGYVVIETKSGQTRCRIHTKSVGCEAPFTNSPLQDGEHTNGVSVSESGSVQWVLGNIGGFDAVTIDYRTYYAEGWTIAASKDGTRFTNERSGHGMFVSIEKVDTY
jgi:hypothetical protein